MKIEPARTLTDSERELGIYVFGLIYDWKKWVHRRVERVSFAGTVTYLRRTSIDFTIPRRPTPLSTAEDRPLFCLPLALLQKQRLRRFNMTDEAGRSLPLLTRHKNGAVACAVLIAAVRATTDLGGEIPARLYEDLWGVANTTGVAAAAHWERLAAGPIDGGYSKEEEALRRRITEHADFLALAADLATNFLVLTVLDANFDQRRILKFEYEEQALTPPPALRAKRRARRAARRTRSQRRRHRRTTRASKRFGGTGTLVVRTAVDAQPSEGVTVTVEPDGPGEQRTTTGPDGTATFAVQPGHHTVAIVRPAGTVPAGHLVPAVSVKLLETSTLNARYRTVPDAARLREPSAASRPLTLRRRLTRNVGWRSKPIVIPTPAVGHGASFHLEVEAPEGLQISRARLRSGPPRQEGLGPRGATDGEDGPLQRIHLYLDDAPQGHSGLGVIHLRPRPALMVRAATLNALVATMLIALTAALLKHLAGVLDPVAALLLFVPGGLSAYTARPRENSMTTSLVSGVRFLAIAVGATSLAAACVAIFERIWTIDKTSHLVEAGKNWALAAPLLWVCSGAAFLIALALGATWYSTARMPERRQNG